MSAILKVGSWPGSKVHSQISGPNRLLATFPAIECRSADRDMIEIRRVRLDEIRQVLSLIDQFNRPRAVHPSDEDVKRIVGEIESSGGCVLGAFQEAQLVGTCTLNLCPNLSWSGRPYAMIENVIVDSGYRGQGIGKNLLEKAQGIALDSGCYKVALMTGSKKDETLKFYEAAGFVGNKTGFQRRFGAW